MKAEAEKVKPYGILKKSSFFLYDKKEYFFKIPCPHRLKYILIVWFFSSLGGKIGFHAVGEELKEILFNLKICVMKKENLTQLGFTENQSEMIMRLYNLNGYVSGEAYKAFDIAVIELFSSEDYITLIPMELEWICREGMYVSIHVADDKKTLKIKILNKR